MIFDADIGGAATFSDVRTLSITPCRSGDSSDGELPLAKLVADLRPKDRSAAARSDCSSVADADVHQQRIDDPVAREGIDLEPALVGRQAPAALSMSTSCTRLSIHTI